MSILSFPVHTKAKEKGLTVTDEMKLAIQAIGRGESPIFITGGAGTGKSTLLQIIREEANPTVAILAPTGIAAMNVRGSTIHSFFRFPPRLMTQHEFKRSPSLADVLRQLSGLIIDEVSMVRADLMDAIDATLKVHLDPSKPFGGLQVVFVGDLMQLPPIVDGDDLKKYFASMYESPYFFDSAALRFCPIRCHRLSETFRQTDPTFISLLKRIRNGTASLDDLRRINERVSASTTRFADAITLTTTRKLAEDINRTRLDSIPGAEKTFRATVTGKASEREFPTDETLRLKVGAKIMMLQNNGDAWQNGTLGTVIAMGNFNGEEAIQVKLPQGEFWVTRYAWEIIRYTKLPHGPGITEEVVGAFRQFPIRLAWAVTIHKSQGMTFDSVSIDLQHRVFEHGQLYVALSRCRSLEGIRLTTAITPADIKCHPRVQRFEAEHGLA